MGVLFDEAVLAQRAAQAGTGADSPFRRRLAQDSAAVFLSLAEFGLARSVRYDGVVYENIQTVWDEDASASRYSTNRMRKDYGQGLYKDTAVLYCRRCDLGGKKPESGARVEVESERKAGFWRGYNVLEAVDDEGMLAITLEKVDE